MKIKVWQGATLNEATKLLVKNIDNSDLNKEHIVIVPDRFSLCMERMLLNNLPRKAMFNVSVMGLTALATMLLGELGVKTEVITMADALLLTAQAIKNKFSEFKSFKKSNINFCHEVYKVISQFKSCGVKTEELFTKQGSIMQQHKYHDLGLIYQEYEALLGGRLDANGLLDYFNSALVSSNILKDKVFYFAQFDSLTQNSYEVLKTLVTLSDEVNISLPTCLSPANEYIYEDDLFFKLKMLAKELCINLDIYSEKSSLNSGAKAIVENLYSLSPASVERNDFLTVIASSSLHEEVELIGKIIRYKVVGGARYKDFAIACSDIDKYSDLFEKVLNQLDIPYYIDRAETADQTLLASFVLKILDVFIKDYSKESLLSLCSDPIFSEKESEELCKKIISYNIYGKARYKKHFAHLAPRMEQLLNSFEEATSYSELCQVCKSVIESFKENYLQVLENLKANYVKEFNINIQIEEIIIDALDKIILYKGGETCNKAEFVKLLKLLLSFKEVSSVPTFVDAVMIGDATASYFAEVKNLIVVGGENLPIISGDNGLISDDDIAKLSAIRKIEPSIRMLNRRNRFKLFNLLSSAQELIVSYLDVNDEGKRIEVPAYIEGLLNIFKQKILQGSAFSSFARLHREIDLNKLCLSSGSRKLALERGIIARDNCIQTRQLIENAKALFFPKGYVKVTQLETYFSCPFKHFVRYGLRAKESEIYEFDPRDIGNICHKFAELFVKENKHQLGSLGDEDILSFVEDKLFDAIKEENLEDKLNITVDKDSTLDYVKRMALLLLTRINLEQKYSQFRPVYTEKSLEGELEGKSGTLKLIGKIDRIDVSGDYFRIMDYKTGQVNPILKDLYYGDKLQLFLYENISSKSLGKTPAGALYFDARWDYDKEDSKEYLLKGLVVNDEEVLPMFDSSLSSGKSEIVAVSKSAKGYKGSALAKFPLMTFENYAQKVAEGAIDEIIEGYIEAKPDQFACDKCAFKSVCLFDKNSGYRKKSPVVQEDIANAEVKNA